MISLRYSIFITLCTMTWILSSCKKGDSNTKKNSAPLTITSISLNHGPFGTLVVVKGTGFDTSATNDNVYFNGKLAPKEIYPTTTSFTAFVPMGAGTGNVSIVVDGKTATGPVFTYEFTGVVSVFAGNGQSTSVDGLGLAASFNEPWGMASDVNSNLYVTEKNGSRIRKISPAANVITVAGSGSNGAVNGTGTGASFNNPLGVTVDNSENIFVADSYNALVRKISQAGVVTTLAGNGIFADVDGDGLQASFREPSNICADNAGNIFVADEMSIRKITASGQVTTVIDSTTFVKTFGSSSNLNLVTGVATDNSGNVYFAYDNFIGAINSTGKINTLDTITAMYALPGQGPPSIFVNYSTLVVDKIGNIFFTDPINYLVREISTSGAITTIAGDGMQGADNGTGPQVSFGFPKAITIDQAGNLYVTDYNEIRKIVLE